jgi:predicted TPR repeat methyltransferase
VEQHDGPEDYVLRESRRYAHSEDYLRRLFANFGFTAVRIQSDTIRMDRAAPVTGLIVTARRVLN